MSALRALLAGIVDYAGLFPPASLEMPTAVRNYAEYLEDADAWMLGRFVVPVARLGEFAAAQADVVVAPERVWHLSALLGNDAAADVEHARTFNVAHAGRAVIDSLEGKLATPDDVRRIASATAEEFELFVEIPVQDDPARMIEAVGAAGVNAKVRTGGITPDSIPTPEVIVRFIRACLDRGVPFKATAGLHHPLRAEYPLTYDAGAPTGIMYGYLNVFLAAALMAKGLSDHDAARVLEERNASAFEISADRIGWNGYAVSAEAAQKARELVAVSFGSCSFREPVDELRSFAPMLVGR
jgi:hypothetical protein